MRTLIILDYITAVDFDFFFIKESVARPSITWALSFKLKHFPFSIRGNEGSLVNLKQ